MMERRKLVEMWRRGEAGDGGTLVTLVRVEGSSYRQPGARLLIQSGSGAGDVYAGTISGGCLEADVVRKAGWIARESAVIERYSTSFDDTAEIPFGLGCGGTVDLLFESVRLPEGAALMQAMAASLGGRESTVVSFLPGEGRKLRRVIVDSAGDVVFASPELSGEKIHCARQLRAGETYDGRFVELLRAPQRLFVLGAGDDAKPLVEMAALLGWSVVVADGRAQLARAERFPGAEQVTRLDSVRQLDLAIGSRDAVILMTHSYEQDREMLVQTLPRRPAYLGLLGSRHRSSLLASEAAAMLDWSVEDVCANVFAPVGLDIGGDGPEAIALAIVAEVQSVSHGRIGSQRRLTTTEVASQIEKGGASLYLQAHCALNAG